MRATFLTILLALSGCSAAQCDPTRADFFSGVGCSVGGGYGQRTGALQNTLSTEQNRDIAARREAGQQEHIAAASEAEAQSLQRRVEEMQRSQAKLRQQLAVAQQRRGAQDATLQQARRDVDQLDRKIREQQASPSPDAAVVRQLERNQNQLLQLISQI